MHDFLAVCAERDSNPRRPLVGWFTATCNCRYTIGALGILTGVTLPNFPSITSQLHYLDLFTKGDSDSVYEFKGRVHGTRLESGDGRLLGADHSRELFLRDLSLIAKVYELTDILKSRPCGFVGSPIFRIPHTLLVNFRERYAFSSFNYLHFSSITYVLCHRNSHSSSFLA